ERAESPTRLALFFDEIEGLLEHHFSDAFLMTLRNLFNQREKYPGTLVVAAAGAVDSVSLVKDPEISPFNAADDLLLDDFSSEEARQLTAHLTDLGVPVAEEAHACIFAWTRGQPYLTQRVCAVLEDRVASGVILGVSSDDVDRVVRG